MSSKSPSILVVMLSLSRTKVSKLARGVAIIMRVVCAGGVGGAGGLAPASRLWPVHARSPS